jgi:hypothetical protein
MTQEVELQIGIPDYYREDLISHEFDRYLENALVESQKLGITLQFYLMEFRE